MKQSQFKANPLGASDETFTLVDSKTGPIALLIANLSASAIIMTPSANVSIN